MEEHVCTAKTYLLKACLSMKEYESMGTVCNITVKEDKNIFIFFELEFINKFYHTVLFSRSSSSSHKQKKCDEESR